MKKKLRLLHAFLFLCSIGHAQTARDVANTFLTKKAAEIGLTSEDIKNLRLKDNYETSSTGVQHFYFQQTYKEIPFHNAVSAVSVKDGRVIHFSNSFIADVAKKIPSELPTLTADLALMRAAANVNLAPTGIKQLSMEQLPNGKTGKVTFNNAGISRDDIPVELLWLPLEDGKQLKLVWNVRINDKKSANWWNVRVDAQNGQFLDKDNWTLFCSFGSKKGSCNNAQHNHHSKDVINTKKQSDRLLANTYNVFDMPLESPSHGNRTVVSTPWTRIASGTGPGATNGWHHTATGTSYTTTRGNNVLAQEDTDGNNGTGTLADGGASLDFNFSFDFYGTPTSNQNAAITNLFFWNNLVHDVLYKHGFDEVAGNFQSNNLGRGGAGNDYVLADAQDGTATDNANFSTPADGTSGRMQMYLWSPASLITFTANSPAGVAGNYGVVESAFSTANKLANVGPKTGNLIIVDDNGAATTNLGCNANIPFDNAAAISGKIAVIDRGVCGFAEKCKNAENAGAIAVLVCNNVAGSPIVMGGTDNTITIPAVMMSQGDCNTLKIAMQSNTVNITMSAGGTYTPDGDFDNGIIAHEYGHGWSTRLTGGPATSCLTGDEQMGEGWSDFLALMLTTNWGATTQSDENDVRGIGTYAIGQPTSGGGIRPFPYTYDISVNGTASYANVGNTATFSIPHGVGSIWCTILWDMLWEMARVDGGVFEANVYNTANPISNVAALLLVTDGLKLQGCSPGFVTGRDAILAADQARFNGKYRCAIWKAFARRGLGVSASQGSSASVTDGTAAYDIPSGVSIVKTASPTTATEGGTVTFTITTTCGCQDQNNVIISDQLPTNLTYVSGSGGSYASGIVSFPSTNLLGGSTQSVTFQAVVNAGTWVAPVTLINDNMSGSTPAGGWAATKLAGTGTKNWKTNTTLSNSATTSWYAENYNALADIVLTSASFAINNDYAELTFWHRFETEAGYDGGVVEISTDGGTTWTDLGTEFVTNGYNGTISSADGSNIAGRTAFTGNSGTTFQQSKIVLCGYSGQSIRVRFRFVADGGVAGTGINGWYVDDVQLIQKAGIENTAEAKQGATTIATDATCIQALCSIPTQIPTAVGTYTANQQCTDAAGWTHYWYDGGTSSIFTDDYLLLSIKKDATINITPSQVVVGVTGVGGYVDLSNIWYKTGQYWHVMNRYWNATPTTQPAAAGVPVRFYYTNADFTDVSTIVNSLGGSVTTHADLEFYKFTTGSGVNPNPTTNHTGSTNPAHYLVLPHTHSTLNGFNVSQFTAPSFSGGGGGGSAPLPIELLGLKANGRQSSIMLEWATAFELNNNGFEIERSTQARSGFTKIAWIDGKGNTTSGQRYAFEDKTAVPSVNCYYRLKQIDKDGRYTYSNVVLGFIKKGANLTLFPNPTNNEVVVRISDVASLGAGNAMILLRTVDGKEVLRKTFEANKLSVGQTINVENLPKGVYLLQAEANGIFFAEKLIVE